MTSDHLGAAGCFHNHHQSWFNIDCWNVCSLVEAEESVATASVRRGVQVDNPGLILVAGMCALLLRLRNRLQLHLLEEESKWTVKSIFWLMSCVILI